MAIWARFAYRRDINLLRTYVYDAQYPYDADQYPEQRAYFDALAAQPGIRLRLGHLVEPSVGSPRAAWQQRAWIPFWFWTLSAWLSYVLSTSP